MEMEANSMTWRYGLIFILSLNLQAAVKKPVDELARYRSEVMELGARLSTIEKDIGSKNNLYLSSLEQIRQFEADIKLYRKELESKQREVHKGQEENKKILQSYLIESENESAELWQKRVHLELLKRAQTKLLVSENELKTFRAKIDDFDQKLSELRKNEEELSLVIREMETRKKAMMETYLQKVDSKKRMESKVSSQKIHQKIALVKKQMSDAPIVEAKPDRLFQRPVEDFLSLVPSQKGVTFKFQATQPIKAVGEGKVVFAGDLAAYGQVLLIDHGNDLRTVLLGRMNIRVKKNDSVVSGDVLAYTVNETKEAQNLYFEVRKKNTAQNTILWLDQKGVSKI